MTTSPHADQVALYAGALRMVRDAIEELFGPVASLESEEAVLLRGPMPHHAAEAIIAALQRVKEAIALRTPSDGEVEKLAWTAVQSAAEWDDRTSPDGYEEYLFFKPDELHQILVSFFETATPGKE